MAKDVGNGWILSVDFAGGSSYVAVAQVQDVTPPPCTMGAVDVTCLDSTFTEYRPDEVEDYGDMSFSLAFDWDLSGHQAFRTNAPLGTIASWKCTPPGNSGTNTISFSGFLTAFTPGSVTPKGLQTASCTVKLTSVVTYVD